MSGEVKDEYGHLAATTDPAAAGGMIARHVRGFLYSQDVVPFSERTHLTHPFVRVKDPAEHIDIATQPRLPVVHDMDDLVPSYGADPYAFDFWETLYNEKANGGADFHYTYMREPTFPRPPNIDNGELASGANLIRTTV